MSDDLPILIIGGGLGGMTAAIALQRQGATVRVFERASAFGDVGAGISLGRSASRGLYALGLRDALIAASDPPAPSAALHYQTGEVLGGGYSSRRWSGDDLIDINMLHRADLFGLLKAAVDASDSEAVKANRTFARFEQNSAGVTAYFTDGGTAHGKALIGCDGIRSAVRAQLVDEGPPKFTGKVAYRFLVPMEIARPFMGEAVGGIYVGPGRSLLRYPIRHGSVVNCVAFAHGEAWRGEGWSQRVDNEELMALFPGWHPNVVGLAQNAPREGTAKWALYDRDPISFWTQGRVTLLGDAAHPLLPFLGFGAALAIEDAVVIGRAFGQDSDVAAALILYERARLERATLIQLESRRRGEMFENGPNSSEPPWIDLKQQREYDPALAPL